MKTVAEYALENGVSTTTIYNRISKGVLKGFKQDGITYVLDEEAVSSNHSSNHVSNGVSKVSKGVENPGFIQELFEIIKERDKEIKTLHKEIKRLTKKLEKCKDQGNDILLSYIGELKQIKALAAEPEIIEAETVKPKKGKKKKGKKQ